MDDFDLNLNNYSLNDLLNLFHLPYNFDKEQLRQAKIVLKRILISVSYQKNIFYFSKAYKTVTEFMNTDINLTVRQQNIQLRKMMSMNTY